MSKNRLILIRHGRSQYNIHATSDPDSGLTEFGHKQAKNVARFLKKQMGIKWPENFMFSTSPFLRCLQTMSYIKEEFGLKDYQVNVLPKLREYINHSGREVTIPCHHKEFPYSWACSFDPLTFKEETNEQFFARMQDAHREVGTDAVVVTHGLPLVMLKHLEVDKSRAIPLWDHNIDNCSITYIVDGQVIWMGRNLHNELDEDVYDKPKPYDFVELNK